MENQARDRLTLETTFPTTSLESLAKGYILTCRCEGKSPATITIYETVLRNFLWYCRTNSYPEGNKLTPIHIRQFLWYLASEPNRWESNNPAARKPASLTTVHDYYRALHSFFNWLEREELVADNPFRRLKAPKKERKVIQALTVNEIEHLFQVCSGKAALDVRNKAILSVFLDSGLEDIGVGWA